jgi:hypothetical protein
MGRHSSEHMVGSCAVCLNRATHLASGQTGPPVWLCGTHFEMLVELRKGRVRQSIDSMRWWFRRHSLR